MFTSRETAEKVRAAMKAEWKQIDTVLPTYDGLNTTDDVRLTRLAGVHRDSPRSRSRKHQPQE